MALLGETEAQVGVMEVGGLLGTPVSPQGPLPGPQSQWQGCSPHLSTPTPGLVAPGDRAKCPQDWLSWFVIVGSPKTDPVGLLL